MESTTCCYAKSIEQKLKIVLDSTSSQPGLLRWDNELPSRIERILSNVDDDHTTSCQSDCPLSKLLFDVLFLLTNSAVHSTKFHLQYLDASFYDVGLRSSAFFLDVAETLLDCFQLVLNKLKSVETADLALNCLVAILRNLEAAFYCGPTGKCLNILQMILVQMRFDCLPQSRFLNAILGLPSGLLLKNIRGLVETEPHRSCTFRFVEKGLLDSLQTASLEHADELIICLENLYNTVPHETLLDFVRSSLNSIETKIQQVQLVDADHININMNGKVMELILSVVRRTVQLHPEYLTHWETAFDFYVVLLQFPFVNLFSQRSVVSDVVFQLVGDLLKLLRSVADRCWPCHRSIDVRLCRSLLASCFYDGNKIVHGSSVLNEFLSRYLAGIPRFVVAAETAGSLVKGSVRSTLNSPFRCPSNIALGNLRDVVLLASYCLSNAGHDSSEEFYESLASFLVTCLEPLLTERRGQMVCAYVRELAINDSCLAGLRRLSADILVSQMKPAVWDDLVNFRLTGDHLADCRCAQFAACLHRHFDDSCSDGPVSPTSPLSIKPSDITIDGIEPLSPESAADDGQPEVTDQTENGDERTTVAAEDITVSLKLNSSLSDVPFDLVPMSSPLADVSNLPVVQSIPTPTSVSNNEAVLEEKVKDEAEGDRNELIGETLASSPPVTESVANEVKSGDDKVSTEVNDDDEDEDEDEDDEDSKPLLANVSMNPPSRKRLSTSRMGGHQAKLAKTNKANTDEAESDDNGDNNSDDNSNDNGNDSDEVPVRRRSRRSVEKINYREVVSARFKPTTTNVATSDERLTKSFDGSLVSSTEKRTRSNLKARRRSFAPGQLASSLTEFVSEQAPAVDNEQDSIQPESDAVEAANSVLAKDDSKSIVSPPSTQERMENFVDVTVDDVVTFRKMPDQNGLADETASCSDDSSCSFQLNEVEIKHEPDLTPLGGRDIPGIIKTPNSRNVERRVTFNRTVLFQSIPRSSDSGGDIRRRLARYSFSPPGRQLMVSKLNSTPERLVTGVPPVADTTNTSGDIGGGSPMSSSSSSSKTESPLFKRSSRAAKMLDKIKPRQLFDADTIPSEPVFPPLVDCSESIGAILAEIRHTPWTALVDFQLHHVQTIGDLAKMNHRQVMDLPVRSPVVSTIKNALSRYKEKMEDNEKESS